MVPSPGSVVTSTALRHPGHTGRGPGLELRSFDFDTVTNILSNKLSPHLNMDVCLQPIGIKPIKIMDIPYLAGTVLKTFAAQNTGTPERTNFNFLRKF